MALTAGTLSQVAVTANSISVSSTPATGGTGPYTEAYYISTTSGFTPGVGNQVIGASGLSATITGLTPNTKYYVEVVYTDTGNGNATVDSAQLASVTGASTLSQNQFQQSPTAGMLDMRFDYDTVSAQIDVSQTTPLYAGAAVKLVPSNGAVNSAPKVVGITAATDNVFGFINFDIKTVAFVAGSLCELSLAGNVVYLYSVGAITQGTQVTSSLITMGGVAQATGSSNANLVGFAYDGAASAGTLIRIKLNTPSFAFD